MFLNETELSVGKRMQLAAILMKLEWRALCHDVIVEARLQQKRPAEKQVFLLNGRDDTI